MKTWFCRSCRNTWLTAYTTIDPNRCPKCGSSKIKIKKRQPW